MDLLQSGSAMAVEAVQGDSCSRCLEFSLYAAEKPFWIPDNTSAIIRYKKKDQTGGEYDTLPNNARAWTISGNVVTITLAPQVLTFPGNVDLSVTLIYDGKLLTTFPVCIDVKPVARVQTAESQNYFYVTSILSAPGNARTGEYLRVSAVNDQGFVTEVESVPIESASGEVDSEQVYALVEQYLTQNPSKGEPGLDGISATHSWDGTVLTITSASGTSSADLKGEKGATGPQGPKGEKGTDGTGVTILGSFDSEEALQAAHATGNIGDSYLVGGYLYVWSATDAKWTNVGKIQGPQGEDGVSPVRGEDYWTAEDIAEIKEYIDDAVTDTFGKGVSIPSSSDLNNYTAIGKYYASSNSLAASLVNCPTTQNFMMYVFYRTSGTPSQMIIDLTGKLYIRSKSSSAWRSWVTYLTTNDLTTAVNEALQEAKDSGAFKGDTGEQGPQGEKGDTGAAGTDGKDAYAYAQDGGYLGTEEEFALKLATDYIDWFGVGVSIPKNADLNTYKTNGKYYASAESLAQTLSNCPTTTNFVMFVFQRTTGSIYSQLIITLHGKMYIRSSNSSAWKDWVAYTTSDEIAELTATVKQEITPVKGTDYWTEEDQESIVQQVIAALGTPVVGLVDEDNNIVLTGNLDNGTYTLRYEDADGNQTVIGTMEIGSMINQIPLSTDENGAVFNAVGYQNDYRISSSGVVTAFEGQNITGFIPCVSGDIVRFKADMFDADETATAGYNAIATYTADKVFIQNVYVPNNDQGGIRQESDTVYIFAPSDIANLSSIGFVRFCLNRIDGDSIVTVNQPIA